ncbi:MAG: NAD(P)-dependent oxidoreductase [Paracoccus sp. (in: a-proteobacteria)]|nr:NAD(P)-dependent oxidoreductase [Paracoccus sp. (in: a-proteobacteria)]
MRIAVTGGGGLVGRFIVNEALGAGDRVTVLGRRAPVPGFFDAPAGFMPFDLAGEAPDLAGYDAVVHAAFDHVPGRYRGGEGDDPAGFLARNLDGSARLFAAAARAGARVVFISTRAVYGPHPGRLGEDVPCRPDTLYGRAKLGAEQVLAGQPAMILRATGVYGPAGPGQRHKWADLFDDFAAGRPIAPRAGTEVHGADLAAAVRLGLAGAAGVYNVSDLLLDRHDLLAEWARLSGRTGAVPARADRGFDGVMTTTRLRDLGWRPGGLAALRRALAVMAGANPPQEI